MEEEREIEMRAIVYAIGIVIISQLSFAQSQYKLAYDFGTTNGIEDGIGPNGGLVFDRDGNIYGTTRGGGNNITPCGGDPTGCGTVFELSPVGNGTWAETIIHRFCDDAPVCSDGLQPWAGLVMDKFGNLYGTTMGGGDGYAPYGTAFELSKKQDGTWEYMKVWDFNDGDAWGPVGKLILDSAGNLYGTTNVGGYNGGGTVFELSRTENGWTRTTLHSFSQWLDGAEPYAGVVFDRSGNLYGTTFAGGNASCDGGFGCGTVFELTPNGDGTWSEAFFYQLSGWDGGLPRGEVNLDGVGNLYTTATYFGPYAKCQCGGILRMTYVGNSWNFSGIHPFKGQNGAYPQAGIMIDKKSRTIYGTTLEGGPNTACRGGCGTVYEIHGTKESVIYNFCSQPNCTDGYWPWSSLYTDGVGNLYGSTDLGGTHNYGVIFEITP